MVKGVIGVAFILAVVHGILFFLADIPYAGIWTLLIFVLAIIQIPIVSGIAPYNDLFVCCERTRPRSHMDCLIGAGWNGRQCPQASFTWQGSPGSHASDFYWCNWRIYLLRFPWAFYRSNRHVAGV